MNLKETIEKIFETEIAMPNSWIPGFVAKNDRLEVVRLKELILGEVLRQKKRVVTIPKKICEMIIYFQLKKTIKFETVLKKAEKCYITEAGRDIPFLETIAVNDDSVSFVLSRMICFSLINIEPYRFLIGELRKS